MDKYSYYKSLNKKCPICMRTSRLYESHTHPERHFRCFCCWDCYKNINYLMEKAHMNRHNYYEDCKTDVHRNYISRILSIAFGNEGKLKSLHLSNKMYFHPNGRSEGSDPMLM
jgi:hypothetical protein